MVFAAIRPGGTAGRTADERIALDLGLLGQETTGAGGISYALRSIPRMLELAAEMRRRCPEAWLLNFTNPAGMVTEALVPVLGRKVVGICDSASGLVHRAARAAGVALPRGKARRRGLLRPEPPRLAVPAGVRRPGRAARSCWRMPRPWPASRKAGCFRQAFLAGLGCLPNEYLYYYYETARAVAGIRASAQTRGESIDRQQSELYPRLAAAGPEAYPLWDAARRSREEGYLAEARTAGERRDESDLAGGGYERVALAAMRALSGGGEAELILNTPNTPAAGRGSRPGRAGGSGAARGRRRRGSLPGDARRRCAAAAGPSGSGAAGADAAGQGRRTPRRPHGREPGHGQAREAALAAFARHPLVDSEVLAGQLLAGYEAAFPELGISGAAGTAPGRSRER